MSTSDTTPPATPDALPAAPDALPAAPDALPAAPDALPEAPDALPEAPDALPAAPDAPAPRTPPASDGESATTAPRRECAAELRERFPALFGEGFKPLKLRIQADIQQRAPGVFGKQALSAFLARYTGSTGYLVAVTKAPHRFDLDGAAAGDISEVHRQAALDELQRRRANARGKIEQAEEGRRKRASLLRDFETTRLTVANFCALKGVAPGELDRLLDIARREAREQPPERRHPRPPQGRRPDNRTSQGPRGKTPSGPRKPGS